MDFGRRNTFAKYIQESLTYKNLDVKLEHAV